MKRLRLALAEGLLKVLPKIAPRDFSGIYIREVVETYFRLRAESQEKLRGTSFEHYQRMKRLREGQP